MNNKIARAVIFIVVSVTLITVLRYSWQVKNSGSMDVSTAQHFSKAEVTRRGVTQVTVPQTVVTAADLVGTWRYSLADPRDPLCKKASSDTVCFPNDSEEISLTIESGKKVYNSYIHGRPDIIDCIWSLKQNEITVHCSQVGEFPDQTYIVSSHSKESLTLALKSDGQLSAPIIYTAYNP